MKGTIFACFKKIFSAEPIVVRSPGRINLIGEHTDYNDGFVLPASVDKYIYAGINKRADQEIHLYSMQFNEECKASLNALSIPKQHWAKYILGVVAQLQKNSFPLAGFNFVFGGDIPMGAGMSSSAALEIATIFALNEIFSLSIPKMQMVKMAQLAEHEYAGVKCGIMDQFASMFGKENNAMQLDCRSLHFEYVPIEMKAIKIVLLNTHVKHQLASSEYNVRRQQCEEAVNIIARRNNNVKSLRDANMQMLDEWVKPVDTSMYKRCKYVVEEIDRLQMACNDLKNGDIAAFGKKMFETHDGLSRLYNVSCPEADFLVNAVRNNKNVLGARMMGGGFGGCTINLVKENAIDALIHELKEPYLRFSGLEMEAYIASIKNGTELC